MAQDTIRFRRIQTDSGLVAVAEVPLFRGVYLRGWTILRKGDEVTVVPPYKVYRHPDTGEKLIIPLLTFESEETKKKWTDKVKEEYEKWEKREAGTSTDQPQIGKDAKVWDQQKETAGKKDDIG